MASLSFFIWVADLFVLHFFAFVQSKKMDLKKRIYQLGNYYRRVIIVFTLNMCSVKCCTSTHNSVNVESADSADTGSVVTSLAITSTSPPSTTGLSNKKNTSDDLFGAIHERLGRIESLLHAQSATPSIPAHPRPCESHSLSPFFHRRVV